MDDKTKTGSPDSRLINVNEDYELNYWAKDFGVTPEELKNAVVEVGPSVKAVKEYLIK